MKTNEDLFDEWYAQRAIRRSVIKPEEAFLAACEIKDKEIEELKHYKTMWQEIGGKANLSHLVKEIEKLKEQLEKAHEEINDLEETLESCAVSFDWIASNSYGEVKEYAINNSKLIRLDTNELIKQLEQG